MAICVIFCGCVLVVIGLTGKVFYGADDNSQTPIPTRLGKTLFIAGGVLLIFAGFLLLWRKLLH